MSLKHLGLLLALCLVLVPIGYADPIGQSLCTWDNTAYKLTCDLYENTVEGSGLINLDSILPVGTDIGTGFLVLYEPGVQGLAQLDPLNWSDIVQFSPRAVELFSDPLSAALIQQVNLDPTKVRLMEETGPPTIYAPAGAEYRIYSDVGEVPEPASLAFLGTVVAGIALRRFRRR